jgi:hypothetical protein
MITRDPQVRDHQFPFRLLGASRSAVPADSSLVTLPIQNMSLQKITENVYPLFIPIISISRLISSLVVPTTTSSAWPDKVELPGPTLRNYSSPLGVLYPGIKIYRNNFFYSPGRVNKHRHLMLHLTEIAWWIYRDVYSSYSSFSRRSLQSSHSSLRRCSLSSLNSSVLLNSSY